MSIRSVILFLALAFWSAAHAQRETFPSAASSAHGWVLMSLGDADQRVWGVYHLPNELAPAVVRFGPRIAGRPERLAAHADRLVIVHAPPTADEVERIEEQLRVRPPSVRRVETLTVAPGRAEGFYEYRPVGRRPEAWPALTAEGRLEGFTLSGAGAFALLVSELDGGATLLRLDGLSWVEVALPQGAASFDSLSLAPGAETATLVGTGPGAGALWTLSADFSEWVESPARPAAGAESVAVDPSGRLLAWRYDGETKRLDISTIEGDRAIPLATVEGVGGQRVVLPAGERLTVLWRDASQEARFAAVVLSTITGETLYSGPLDPEPVVSGRDLQTLSLLLGAVLLTVLIFVLRADPTQDDVVALPAGWALAAPLRRFIATVIDLGVPLAALAALLGVRMQDALAAAFLLESADLKGGVAFVAALSITIAHSTIGEWRFGRTIGKALLGVRVFAAAPSRSGERPRFWQALVRCSVKYLCPPLAIFVVLDPRRRHPADLLARAVVAQKAPPAPPAPPTS